MEKILFCTTLEFRHERQRWAMRLITTMLLTGILVVSNVAISGPESATLSKYNRMKQLEGEWVLSPATRQEGKATQHKVVAPLVGTDYAYPVRGRQSPGNELHHIQ
jgi:hypothetical protein